MQHTFFALFDDPKSAAAAVSELEAGGARREHFGVVMHEDSLHTSELHIGESAALQGATRGAVAGGAFGALFGALVLGPIGLVGAGAAAALFGGLVGTAAGGAMGGLAASSAPDPRLEALAAELKRGKVLLTVEAAGLTSEEHAEEIIARHGGQVHHRTMV